MPLLGDPKVKESSGGKTIRLSCQWERETGSETTLGWLTGAKERGDLGDDWSD